MRPNLPLGKPAGRLGFHASACSTKGNNMSPEPYKDLNCLEVQFQRLDDLLKTRVSYMLGIILLFSAS